MEWGSPSWMSLEMILDDVRGGLFIAGGGGGVMGGYICYPIVVCMRCNIWIICVFNFILEFLL